jgi:acyl-CoA synthetase (AMP-forming)/AMP-acid ligase II
MNIAEWLARTAQRLPVAAALFTGTERRADYRGFAGKAAGIAAALAQDFAVAPGDRIALYMPNRVEYLEAMYGIWWAGAAVVPINVKLHWKEAAFILEDSGAKAVFVAGASQPPELADAAAQARMISVDEAWFQGVLSCDLSAPVSRDDNDLAWLFYTSGTTGRPKGVMLSHGNLMATSLTYFNDVDDVHESDAALYAAPISHGAGLYSCVHVLRGCRHVVPLSGSFDAQEVLDLAEAVGPISMFAAPTMVRRLTEVAKRTGRSGEGIRTIVYGGGPMYVADIQEALGVFGDKFVQIYGQGESPMCITALSREHIRDKTHPHWERRLASVGLPQACVEVNVVDENGAALPPGEVGEIVVKGPPVMSGYWQAAEATRKTLRQGWLWTGDIGVFDEDGFLTLKDRSKDVIISGGSNIYPREVEECLLLHPSVSEVSVVGEHDQEWGENVIAFVVAKEQEPLTPEDLDRFCLREIARFKRPKSYVFVAELPKNNYGKVLKTELRARLARGGLTKHSV